MRSEGREDHGFQNAGKKGNATEQKPKTFEWPIWGLRGNERAKYAIVVSVLYESIVRGREGSWRRQSTQNTVKFILS